MSDLPYAVMNAERRRALPTLGYRPRVVSVEVLVSLLGGIDALLVVGAAVAVTPSGLRYGSPIGGMYLAASLLAFVAVVVAARQLELYRVRALRQLAVQLRGWAVVLGCGAVTATAVFVLLGASAETGFGWAAAWAASAAALVAVSRLIVTPAIQAGLANGALTRHVAVIGANPLGRAYIAAIAADPDMAHSLVGVFDDDARSEHGRGDAPWTDAARSNSERRVSGKVSDLAALSRRERVDTIVIAHTERAAIERVCAQLRSVVAEVDIATQLPASVGRAIPRSRLPSSAMGPTSRIGDITLVTVLPRALTDWETMQKAAFDRVFAAILLVVLAPVFLALALAIRLDSPGPVFFRQPRLGYNNLPFRMVKFRTMHHAMTDLLADRQTSRNDDRVTRVGRVLRSLSVDELPQLLNVLRGEMSIVGPRPHAPNTRAGDQKLDEAVAEYAERHRVKPGITGWAQVNGSRGELRSVEHIRQRVDYDLEYIQTWSLWRDISIVFLTIRREIFSSRAF